MYFVTNAFLPDYVTAAGRSDLIGPSLTALNLCQLPASFLMLGVAERLVKEPLAYATTGALALVSVIGMMVMTGAWIVVWAGVLGFVTAVTLILVAVLKNSELRTERALQTKLDAIASSLLQDRRGHQGDAERQLEQSIGVHEEI